MSIFNESLAMTKKETASKFWVKNQCLSENVEEFARSLIEPKSGSSDASTISSPIVENKVQQVLTT